MPFCSNCGAKVGDKDKLCADCGARVPGPSAGQIEPPPVNQEASIQPQTAPALVYNAASGGYQQSASGAASTAGTASESSTGLKPNVAALICYFGVWITGIIFLVIEKKSQFVRFHAAQSLVFFGFITVLNILLGGVFWHAWFLSGFLNAVLGLFGFIFWIVLMYKAYQGETYKLPIAGDIAEGIVGKM